MKRVLHVVTALHHGAIEKWLMTNFYRAREINPEIDWTFYCVFNINGVHEAAMRKAGATVIRGNSGWESPIRLIKDLRYTLQSGKYDVLHAHHDLMSAIPLIASVGLRINKKWVHVHNADWDLPTPSKLKRAIALPVFRLICLTLADGIVGITEHTLKHFVGGRFPRQADRVIYYGVDTIRYRYNKADREEIRKYLSIPATARVILFTARMNWFKNPCFVIEMLNYMTRLNHLVYAVFVGEGEQVSSVEHLASEYGLREKVRLVGWREDVERFYNMADLFVFPRVEENDQGIGKEGLGLTLIEAQASGLPVLTSYGVSEEAIVSPELFVQLSLDDGVEKWACQAVQLMDKNVNNDRCRFEMEVASSRFGMDNGLKNLLDLY